MQTAPMQTGNERAPGKQGLDGVRVLEFPDPKTALCSKLLADMGADVVLVEPPEGAPIRTVPPHADATDQSLLFWFAYSGKRSVALDLSQPSGREAFLGLVKRTDVLLDPFQPGHLASLGLDDATIMGANPRVVLLSLTGFGQTGPFRDFGSSDIVAWAMSGMMSLSGDPTREPLTAPAMQGYQVGSLWATIALLAAIYRRLKTGQGARIDLSLQETAFDMSETAHTYYMANKETVVRMAGDHPLACPFRTFKSKDGYAFVCGQWPQILDWMDSLNMDMEKMRDPDLETPLGRMGNRDKVNKAVGEFALLVTGEDLFVQGAQRGMPNAPVRKVKAVLDDDQLVFRDFFNTVADPREQKTGAQYPHPGLPFRSRKGPWKRHATPAPKAGQHTEEVTREWSSPGIAWPEPVEPERALPLEGVNVLDFCWNIAGPTMGRVLADLGTTTVKLEPKAGAPSRMLPAFPGRTPGANRSYTFQDLNRNKLSVTADMKHPKAAGLALKLAAWADVVVENFTAGTMDRLGVGYDKMSEINPRVVVGSLTGYGQMGPRRGWPTFHPTVASLAGLVDIFTYEGGGPMGFGNSYMDYISGYIGAIGVMDGLLRRELTGEGDQVDISFLESGVNLVGTQLMDWTVNSHEAVGEGNRAGALGAALQGCYRCAGDDQWIVVTAADEPALATLAKAIGAAKYDSVPELEKAIAAWTSDKRSWDAFRSLQKAGVAAGVVSSGHDLTEVDEHLKARDTIARLPHPELGEVPIVQCPIVMDGKRLEVRTAGPILSEHTEHVLREMLGLSEEVYLDYVVDEVV